MRCNDTDFEYERRFFVADMPHNLLDKSDPNLIVQTYFLAKQGYAIRIRLQATALQRPASLDLDAKKIMDTYMDHFDLCMLAVKGPYTGGTRYEAEREIDLGVGTQMSQLGGKTLAKVRYGLWHGQDGWVVDEFAGDNQPLIIAECERTSPVIDLQIPPFCTKEVTDDSRFCNDELVNHPFGGWHQDYIQNSLRCGTRFDHRFGTNRHT